MCNSRAIEAELTIGCGEKHETKNANIYKEHERFEIIAFFFSSLGVAHSLRWTFLGAKTPLQIAIIMLLVNLVQRNDKCNGTECQKHVIGTEALNRKSEGKTLIILRIKRFQLQMRRNQFPVRLSYTKTANNSQGQTMKFVGIYMRTEFFSHGQVYVSLLRVGN